MESALRVIFEGLTAVGTIAVAVLAIWGDKIRNRLAPARLEIEPTEPGPIRGTFTRLGQNTMAPNRPGAMWYTLKVVNKRPWRACPNCRVLLVGVSRRGPDGMYRPESFPVPRQFCWAPSESTPTEITLGREHVFDLGFLTDSPMAVFTPNLYSVPNNFPGYVGINQSVRYSLAVAAENFYSPTYQVFEVSWDGQWNESPEEISRHLTVREVTQS